MKSKLTSILFTSLGFLILATASGFSGIKIVYQKPPVKKVKVIKIKKPRSNAIWINGNWRWHNDKYVWKDGYWLTPRKGFIYVPGKWVKRHRGWVWIDGFWKKR